MKGIITFALFALSLSGFAQQRQLVRQQDHRQSHRYVNTHKVYDNYDFRRLDLSPRQERKLIVLLREKQNEEWAILRKYRRPQAQLMVLDRKYDRKIQNILSRSQYNKRSEER